VVLFDHYFDNSRNIVDNGGAEIDIAPMDLMKAAECLEKLGSPARLEIFRLLVRAGDPGLSVGEIQSHLGIPASTLSHHIAQLSRAGLLEQTREGRVLRCRPNWAMMNELTAFLTDECCVLAEPAVPETNRSASRKRAG
jgi:DNA-binding transcriptional ArsR family regulator